HPRRHRGRCQEAAPHHHGARVRLRVRQRAELMRRLYLQIYLTIIAILVIVFIAVFTLGRIAAASRFEHAIDTVTEFADNELPPVSAPHADVRAAIERLHRRLSADVALYASDDRLIASAGRPIPEWRRDRAGRWLPGRGRPSWALALDDG